jgi:hypothetical protein
MGFARGGEVATAPVGFAGLAERDDEAGDRAEDGLPALKLDCLW